MKSVKYISFIIVLFASGILPAQQPSQSSRPDTGYAQGGWLPGEIVDGDTIIFSSLRPVKVIADRKYKDRAERDRLNRYRRYAEHVYPYAVTAIDLYDEIEDNKAEATKRQHRKFVRKQKKVLKSDFEDQLKNLYKTEGWILIKMIERQTGKNCHEIVRETRGPVVAAYWLNLSKIWGFDLKEGYHVGADPLLDEVLLDYDFGEAIWKY